MDKTYWIILEKHIYDYIGFMVQKVVYTFEYKKIGSYRC